MIKIVERAYPPEVAQALTDAGVHPVLARVYAARGINSASDLDTKLSRLIPYTELKNAAIRRWEEWLRGDPRPV